MTKRFCSKNKFFWAWVFFHVAVFIAFGASVLLSGGFKFDADFLNMMPETSSSRAVRAADKALSKSAGENVFILVGHKDFQKAKEIALEVFDELRGKSQFRNLEINADISAMQDAADFVQKWKWHLISQSDRDFINEDAELFAENALAQAVSFTFSGLDNIESDPFLLSESILKNYLGAVSESGVAMQAKDGVLAAEFEGVWYVMIRSELSEKGARLLSKENAVPLIQSVCLPREKDGVRFVFYGTPFHSYKSSAKANAEIKSISVFCSIAVLLLLLAVFKNPVPIAFSLFSVALSVLSALAATHAVFGKIHTLSLVFGTSLLGSSIDYSLHFFISWKAGRNLKSGAEIRKNLLPSLSLSLLSTEICYALLFFAPFNLVKQMAVFSFAGIFSTFLTAIALFPLLKLPKENNRKIVFWDFLEKNIESKIPKIPRKIASFFPLAILLFSALIAARNGIEIKNDIASLYKMEGRLKDDTILAYKILNYNPTNYLIVQGKSASEVLEKEERLTQAISSCSGKSTATSNFIPSEKAQTESLKAAEKLVLLSENQLDFFGFGKESAENLKRDFEESKKRILLPSDLLPSALESVIRSVWIGEVDGEFYSLVVPSQIDTKMLQKIAESEDGVYFESKANSVSTALDKLTLFIIGAFAAAYIVIFIVLRFFFGSSDTIRIATVPLVSVSAILAVFSVLHLKIEFFCVTGMILVFGLGLDYIICRTKNKKSAEEKIAIALSFLTTAISFGALCLSSFVPVKVLGLAILTGLSAAFFCTVF